MACEAMGAQPCAIVFFDRDVLVQSGLPEWKGEFIVVTESGLVHALQKAAPGKTFHELAPRMLCPNMKVTTLVKVRDCLRDGFGEVVVDCEVASRALAAVERMIAIG